MNFETEHKITFLDQDFNQHVNNCQIIKWKIENQVQFLTKLGYKNQFTTISSGIKYIKQIYYPGIINIKCQISKITQNTILLVSNIVFKEKKSVISFTHLNYYDDFTKEDLLKLKEYQTESSPSFFDQLLFSDDFNPIYSDETIVQYSDFDSNGLINEYCYFRWIQDLGRVSFFRKHLSNNPTSYILSEQKIQIIKNKSIQSYGNLKVKVLMGNIKIQDENMFQEYHVEIGSEICAKGITRVVGYDFANQKKMILSKDLFMNLKKSNL